MKAGEEAAQPQPPPAPSGQKIDKNNVKILPGADFEICFFIGCFTLQKEESR